MATTPRSLVDEAFAELFFELANQPASERRQRLEMLALEDAGLANELISLLNAHDSFPGRLETVDPDQAANLLIDDDTDQTPDQVGPFRLISELGRGGIGVVYLGERQSDGFEQKVAIKLIKRGMDSELILDRFQDERRILASLRHPNIAALVDGGMLPNGQPWFANGIHRWRAPDRLVQHKAMLTGSTTGIVQPGVCRCSTCSFTPRHSSRYQTLQHPGYRRRISQVA